MFFDFAKTKEASNARPVAGGTVKGGKKTKITQEVSPAQLRAQEKAAAIRERSRMTKKTEGFFTPPQFEAFKKARKEVPSGKGNAYWEKIAARVPGQNAAACKRVAESMLFEAAVGSKSNYFGGYVETIETPDYVDPEADIMFKINKFFGRLLHVSAVNDAGSFSAAKLVLLARECWRQLHIHSHHSLDLFKVVAVLNARITKVAACIGEAAPGGAARAVGGNGHWQAMGVANDDYRDDGNNAGVEAAAAGQMAAGTFDAEGVDMGEAVRLSHTPSGVSDATAATTRSTPTETAILASSASSGDLMSAEASRTSTPASSSFAASASSSSADSDPSHHPTATASVAAAAAASGASNSAPFGHGVSGWLGCVGR
eukprot:g17137.t1